MYLTLACMFNLFVFLYLKWTIYEQHDLLHSILPVSAFNLGCYKTTDFNMTPDTVLFKTLILLLLFVPTLPVINASKWLFPIICPLLELFMWESKSIHCPLLLKSVLYVMFFILICYLYLGICYYMDINLIFVCVPNMFLQFINILSTLFMVIFSMKQFFNFDYQIFIFLWDNGMFI